MERRCWWYECLAAVALATAILLPVAGCVEIATTAAYLIKGTDDDPDFAGLKGKTVVVVCRPLGSMQYRDSLAAKEVAGQITAMLKEKVPKIKVINQHKVSEWTDEHQWEEFPEVGKAVNADVVVGVDLTSFSTYQGPTLYQGKATASFKVYDLKDDDKVIYEKDMPQIMYPPNIGIPISDKSEADFRREFTSVVAELIARHFYSHDGHSDMANDAKAALE